MSEPIPESIPTSADPRSRRPTKKLRGPSTPLSQQTAAITALFEKQPEIQIPTSSTQPPRTSASLPPPPEIVANVQGSSAGAGSGEFHVYKASRRREYERVRLMEEEASREEADKKWKEKREMERRRDEVKTGKNQKRREKMKAKKEKGREGEGKENEDKGGREMRAGMVLKPMVVERQSADGSGDEESGVGDGVRVVPEEKGIVMLEED